MTRSTYRIAGSSLFVFATSVLAADTLESVEKKLSEQMDARKSIQFKQKSTSDIANPDIRIKTDMDATVKYERRPEKGYASRIEGKSTIVQKIKDDPEKKSKVEMLTIADGKYTYTLSRSEDGTSAMKQKLDPKTAMNPFDLQALFKLMHKDFDFKLLPDESVDGKSCYAIEQRPKDAEKMGDILARSVTYYEKKSGVGIKTVGYDKKDKITSTSLVTEMKLDDDIPDDQFEFKPPPGVKVMDLSQTAQADTGDKASEGSPATRDASDTAKHDSPPAQADQSKEKPAAAEGAKKKDPAGKAIKGLLKGFGR